MHESMHILVYSEALTKFFNIFFLRSKNPNLDIIIIFSITWEKSERSHPSIWFFFGLNLVLQYWSFGLKTTFDTFFFTLKSVLVHSVQTATRHLPYIVQHLLDTSHPFRNDFQLAWPARPEVGSARRTLLGPRLLLRSYLCVSVFCVFSGQGKRTSP